MLRLVVCCLGLVSVGCGLSSPFRSPDDPLALVRVADARGLRAVTFNIQSGRVGLAKVADAIRRLDPDLVALQEVDRGTVRAGGVDQTQWLSEATGLPHHVFFRATDLHRGEYGVALLSRYPLESTEQWSLPVNRGAEPRAVGRVVVRPFGQALSVYVTHFTNLITQGKARERQAAFIAGLLGHDGNAQLLMGDLNEDEGPGVRRLTGVLTDVFALAGKGSAGTYPLPVLADPRLDYVMSSSGLLPLQSFVYQVRASDHFPLVADLEFPAPGLPVVEQAALSPAGPTP